MTPLVLRRCPMPPYFRPAGLKHNEGVPEVDRTTWQDADAFIFAFPTRFGGMPAQMKVRHVR